MGTSQTPNPQREREDGSLRAKIVYFGPANGGKTTNLEALHRVASADHDLLTVKTDDDRTLFFDLLPVELGRFLGCPVVISLYAVPGQVRYEATRKVVLAGADAIVFVADSRSSRREQNVWSLQNLHMNLRAADLDPDAASICFQFNKRDLADAAPPAEVAEWLRTVPGDAVPAVASRGEGVLETLKKALHAVMPRLIEQSEKRGLAKIDAKEREHFVDATLAPLEARLAAGFKADPAVDPATSPIVLSGEDLLEGAIETSVRLSEDCLVETARSRRLAREAETFRRLGESLFEAGASFDRQSMLEAALAVVCELPVVECASLLRRAPNGRLSQEGAARCERDPLIEFASGRRTIKTMLAADGPTLIENVASSCDPTEAGGSLERYGAVAGVPLGSEYSRVLVAYAGRGKNGSFQPEDVDFLRAVAQQLAAGLGKVRAHEDLARNRGRLEQSAARPAPRTGGSRRAVDQMRERLLGSFPSEMRATLATISRAARSLRQCNADQRGKITRAIVGSTELLQHQLEDLTQLIRVTDSQPLRLAEVPGNRVVQDALRQAGHPQVRFKPDAQVGPARVDAQGLARAVAHLIDNAVKFSRPGSAVRVQLKRGRLAAAGRDEEALVVSVLDRGPGVPAEDRERIFAPFTTGSQGPSRKPNKKKKPGLGIGLYEARGQARRHGGTLECFPRKGGGSEFRLTVPLQPIAEPAVTEVTHA